MFEIHYSNELYHHGVKGMKWGVRKKGLRSVSEDAVDSGKWLRVYDKAYKKDTKRVNKRVNKDMRRKGSLSEKTQQMVNDNKILKREYEAQRSSHRQNVKKAQAYVEQMRKDFGKKNIKDIKTYSKKGETYVKSKIFSDSGTRILAKKYNYDTKGNKTASYQKSKVYYQYY